MHHDEMLWAEQEATAVRESRRRRRLRPRESSVEAAFVRLLRRHGLTSLKLNVSGQRGWPDRLVLLPGGRAVFVELKRPGGKARALQRHVHARLKALGFQVAVCDDAAAAAAAVIGFDQSAGTSLRSWARKRRQELADEKARTTAVAK